MEEWREYSNRDLVVFFIKHKLSQVNRQALQLGLEGASDKSSPAGNARPSGNDRSCGGQAATASPPHFSESVKAALQESADEFELRYTKAFSDMSSQLHITPTTAYNSFENVMDEVFRDGINWGRIVGLFAFGGALCVDCVQKDMNHMVPRIVDWMTIYLDHHLDPWIQRQGGWNRFAEIFGGGAAAEARASQTSARRWLLVGVVLLAGTLVGVLILKKSRKQ